MNEDIFKNCVVMKNGNLLCYKSDGTLCELIVKELEPPQVEAQALKNLIYKLTKGEA